MACSMLAGMGQGYLVGGGAKKNGFLCPVCRELNPAPNTRRPPSDWASLLRTDFHIKSLIKALQAGTNHDKRQGQRTENPCSLHGDKVMDDKQEREIERERERERVKKRERMILRNKIISFLGSTKK